MPRFRLTKEPDNTYDAEVTVTFDTDMLDVAKAHFNDFLKASGFEIPFEYVDEVESKSKVDHELTIRKEEDWMWNDAFDFKFRNDGPVGSAGADIIQFPH